MYGYHVKLTNDNDTHYILKSQAKNPKIHKIIMALYDTKIYPACKDWFF